MTKEIEFLKEENKYREWAMGNMRKQIEILWKAMEKLKDPFYGPHTTNIATNALDHAIDLAQERPRK